VDSDGAVFLRADVERFCGEVVDVAPAVRLRMLAELRAMVDEVTSTALTSAMISAQDEGWGLRRIASFAGVSHEQVRRMVSAVNGASAGT
jgi:hypothetical protein